jgi:BirA family transcriptional regulator, biotin operon repressor / biotin---[acetyl-CoA-carboxylase] ligase
MNPARHHQAPFPPASAGSQNETDAGLRAGALPYRSVVGGWTLHEYPVVGSTNLVAADLKAWEAVRADRQSAGRGRFQRRWISDDGGLWLSAVVPTNPKSPAGRALPLAVGLAVCDVLRGLGVQTLRMRWPNDVLVGDRKLAGLLVDQFSPGLAVAGIGINVFNEPEASDPLLKNQTARLAGIIPNTPSLRDLAALALAELRRVINQMEAGSFEALLPRVNQLWGPPRRVELDLDGARLGGIFNGADAAGRLILSDDSVDAIAYEPWQVRHLTEVNQL